MLRSFRKAMPVILVALNATLLRAQTPDFAKMVDFLPPAPNATAMIKYGGMSINKNTGAPNVSIPLFTLTGRKLSASVSIGYASSGIKVDEIASRVGMGWSLNAGGVVTRTMRGVPDELNTRVAPLLPVQSDCQSFISMRDIASSYDVHGYRYGFDAEPDLFNFNMNGMSGSFVLDENMQPVLSGAEKFKVEINFSTSAAWNFKITAIDGIKYYFGGTTATEKTKRLTSCGKSFDEYLPNSWYLIKIEHPNGEVINFGYSNHTYTYDNGVSQTMHWVFPLREVPYISGGASSCESTECSAIPSSKCINYVSTQGVLLNTISNTHGVIEFSYISRSDCSDKLVDRISLRDNQGTLMQMFNFYYLEISSNLQYQNETSTGYNKTPYLDALQEMSGDFQLTKTHRFSYIDPASRAPRLSFSQDHWGYFNGQVNSVFIPLPDDLLLRQRFPQAVANRNAFEEYAQKGMLKKIIYPTGGADSIMYESNSLSSVINAAPRHKLVCGITGTGVMTQAVSDQSFSIGYTQIVTLAINCTDNSGTGDFDPVHNIGRIVVQNSSNAVVYDDVYSPGTNKSVSLNLSQGGYSMKIYANGSVVSTNVSMYYYPSLVNGGIGTSPVGGVRVKAILTGNPGEQPIVKKYFYGELNSLNISSLTEVRTPKYFKAYKVAEPCQMLVSGVPTPVQSYCYRNAMYSNSLNNIFDFQSSPVSYGSVVESLGPNFEGGGTQQKFVTRSDEPGVVEWGDENLGAPLTNFSAISNGKLKEDIVLKKGDNGNLFPIKKTIYSYKIDDADQRIVKGYNVTQEYQIYVAQPVSCPSQQEFIDPQLVNAFDITRYEFISYWVYADAVTEIDYDENGQNPVTKTTQYFYDNPAHHLLTRTQTTNSKGEVQTVTNTYPHENAGQQVYDDMIALRIWSPVISIKSYKGTGQQQVLLTEVKTNYKNWGNGNYLPENVQRGIKGGVLETEGTIDAYDDFGNILQFKGKDGVVNSVLWGYGNQYPIARIIGATYSQAVAATGVVTQALQTSNETNLRNYINNIRTNIPKALVTGYTYQRLVGVTGITDQNNRITTYNYDAFHRLAIVKDNDGKILRKITYQFANPIETDGFAIHWNTVQGQVFTPQSCQWGYTSSDVLYSVPEKRYFSFISVQDANNMALADIAANGQAFANRAADCATDGPCTGLTKKRVGCMCETAVRINSSSYQNANGTWTCVYYYRWSDNSRTQDFTEITATNCKEIISVE